MSFFQESIKKKYLNELESELLDSKYSQFRDYFNNKVIQENIRNAKEEQFQEGFLRELFVNILGYTLYPQPDYNLTTELKNISNSKKVDGAILKNGQAIAVIELKGTDTSDLDKVESQAFGYKNHNPQCIYVITSNFEKIRFYIQNAVEHLNFNLFDMTREQFALMWLCLSKDNLLGDLPLKIKESSLLQEENITKKLYGDYSKFREAVYNNLVKNNTHQDKLLLFKKTQKLLDRFLFVFFAEDRLLLPPNSIREIINQWQTLKDVLDEYVPLYDRFKKYFGYLNTGYKGKNFEVFAYNGGLFATDEILDNITIDDKILYEHTLKLSQYDFDTEVDVNILGHIFEHSLGEIESVQAEIKGEKVESQKSKRKKDGIFYTPKYITKYIVENTVGKLCIEKRNELGIVDEEYAMGRKNRKREAILGLDKKLTDYRNWLLNITILDPACGSGAFLNQALDFLIIEHQKIDNLRAQLFEEGIVFADITTDILENNIFGVDINEESVEIAKLSLWLRTAQKGRKLNTLTSNIKCGNSLIDDPQVAGDKAFNWEKEFPQVFKRKLNPQINESKSNPPDPLKKGAKDNFDEIPLSKGELNADTVEVPLPKGESKGDVFNSNPPDPLNKGAKDNFDEIPLSKGESKGDRFISYSSTRSNPQINESKSNPPGPLEKGVEDNYEEIPLSKGELNADSLDIPLPKGESKGDRFKDDWTSMKDWIIKRGLIYSQYHLPYNPKLVDRAKELRKNMTEPEKKLWYHFLHDFKFRVLRQRTIDNYIVDFYIAEVKLAIEIDGDSHYSEEGIEYDSVRSEILNHYGINVIRFNNLEVMNSFEGVCNSIIEEVDSLYLKRHNNNAQPEVQTNDKLEYYGGFDVVIGNPPYGVNFNDEEKKYLSQFDNLVPDYEIYIYFISLYKKLLKNDSMLAYIFPNTFLSIIYGKKYREELLNDVQVNQIVDLSNDNTFSDASVRTCIFSFQKTKRNYSTKFTKVLNKEFVDFSVYEKNELLNESENILSLFSQTIESQNIIKKLIKNKPLKEYHVVSQGLIPYDKYRGHDEYTIKNRIWHADFKKDDTYKKELKGGDVNRYKIVWNEHLWISYGNWLAAPRDKKFFTSKRILVREITDDTLYCGYTEEEYYNTPSCINIIDESDILDLKYTLLILNSKLTGWLHNKIAPKANKGLFPKILVNDVRNIPLVHISPEAQLPFIELADIMLEKNKVLQDVKNKFLDLLKADFSIEKLSTKLQNWYELTWADFEKELKKAKITLSGEKKEDWFERFNRFKSSAQELKSIIDQTDKQIDQLVYELYELTEEEIKIVEGEG